MNTQSESPTGMLQWLQTYDLDNMSSRVLQQEWHIVQYDDASCPVKSYKEWRNVPVDGGLKI